MDSYHEIAQASPRKELKDGNVEDPSRLNPGMQQDPEKPLDAPSSGPSPPSPLSGGGLIAWLQVVAGFIINFNTWGVVSSFGVFQSYYESGELFRASSSGISWIGCIQNFLLQFLGIIAGPVYDRGYLRHLLCTGSALVVISFMALSLSTKYYQVFLSQGVGIGVGAGLLFAPTVSLISTYFSSQAGLALGIASSGSALGGIIYPVVLSRLIPRVGFPWAVRVVGFIVLVTFSIPLVIMRARTQASKPRAMIDWSAFRDARFMVFTLGEFFSFIAIPIANFYISFYPLDRGLTDQSLAFYIVAIYNAGSVPGRILPNALSDRVGVFNTLAPLSILLGVAMISLIRVSNAPGMIVGAVITGFLNGVVIALPQVCFGVLSEDKSLIGTRLGMGFAISGFGLLAGGPVAGSILRATSNPLNWTGVWVYGGLAACISGLVDGCVRIMESGFKFVVKV
ncbi:monocarboxylate permease-like protein, mch4 [Xylaria sp. FL1042]|nr:monocarboxylate permease-like protein, mch4 [Xylaria sp. FL1042]